MKLLRWCKANAMPVIAVLAAAVTAVFVPPDAAYLGYYDVKTLSCLLCVLAVVGALRRVGLFPLLAQRLVQVFHTTRGAVTALVGITLVGSMLLTNDTALLTFLPLSWFVLERTGQTKWTALTFILQNCAANLGGMLTPFGNPQNLYLFNHYNIPNGEFLSIMQPPFLLSTALILLCCLFLPREGLTVPRQETLLGQIKEILKEKGYGGLDVDFEYIRPELGAAYAAFVDRLRRELNSLGCSVLVALAPKTFAGQRGLLYEAHDYAALGRAANGVLLMTYEWGYTAGPPMAVAPLDKVRQVVDYALTEIPAEKLFLGVPVYGYDWPLPFREGVTRGESVSPQEALALARRHGAEIRYDETAQAPWFRYTAAGGREHEVWFEDARSSYAKFRLAAEKGLQGVGLWNLMRPAPQTYLALHGGFEIEVMR